MLNQSNWLIRTKQNKILGPVSKQKILELLEKGSLTAEDELCSGNGYWFWVKEEVLIEKYLKLNQIQDFNPISEAQTIYALTNSNLKIESKRKQVFLDSESEDTIIPDECDLEYPNPDDFKNMVIDTERLDLSVDIIANTQVKLHVAENDDVVLFPENNDLEYPKLSGKPVIENTGELINILENEKGEDVISQKSTLVEKKISSIAVKGKKKRVKRARKEEEELQKVKDMKKNNNKVYIYIVTLLVSVLLYAVYFYYTSILGKTIVNDASFLYHNAYAQQTPALQKKN